VATKSKGKGRTHKEGPVAMPQYFPPLLRLPYQAFIGRLHEELAARGYPEIRPAHGIVFQYLPATGARVTELATRSQVTKQQLSLLVQDLVERGYLEHRPDPTDGRARVVLPTAAGEALLRVAEEVSTSIERDWAARFGEPRWQQLRSELEELIRSRGLAE
jgi:DNA-binding MarR family transcriptional regulator